MENRAVEPTDQGNGAAGASNVPSLIDEYRAQEDAHRAQARELARLQQEVFTTAAREASEVVSTARSEVRRVILQARRDLLMLAAQVDVIGNMATDGATPAEGTPRTLSAARQDLRQVLHDASGEFQTVTEYSQALQAQTAQLQVVPASDPLPPATTTSPQADPWEGIQAGSVSREETLEPQQTIPAARGTRMFVVAFVIAGAAIVAGTLWWMTRSRESASATAATAPPTAAQPAVSEPPPVITPPPAEPAPAPAPSLSVEARRQAWIRLTQDGRVVIARLVQPGETFRITDAREVSLRSGDAGAVVVSVNGGEAMPLGRDGEVLTRNFVLNEAEQPTTTPPPTATPQTEVKPSTLAPPPAGPSTSVPPPSESGERAPSPVPQAAAPVPPPREEPQTVTRPAPAPPPVRDVPTPTSGAAPATAAPAANPQADIARVAERWLDAYYRQDRATMATLSAPQLILSDERAATDRLPPGLSPVRREMQDVSVRVFGSDAMYVARMTERLENAPAASASGAFVSQMWTMRDGAWHLTNVRIVGSAAISKSVR
jgi:hypothetical protein